MSRFIVSVWLLITLPIITRCQEQEQGPKDPFAGFETIKLPNGLKLWYKRTPDSPDAAISVVVPYGSDQDPAGKEGLAHFTEHMLFSDHLGRTEEQIKREIEDLGGVRNGYTFPDHTFYFVHIGSQHGLFSIDWLYKLISHHAMEPAVVERQREPVLQETGARRRELFDWIRAYYLYPPALRPGDFWKREFGLDTPESRDIDHFKSVNSIISRDLSLFYDTYYVPSRMTLTVIGNLDRDQVLKRVEATFGLLEPRPDPPVSPALVDPRRAHREFYWDFMANPFYKRWFKVYDATADDFVKLIFLSRLLGKRLNDQLRFRDRKASYGIASYCARRGQATGLIIQGGIDKDQYGFARDVIDRELDSLRSAEYSDEEFEIDRSTISRQLKTDSSSPSDLERWVLIGFYNPDLMPDYPDLPLVFDSISKQDLEGLGRRLLVPEREVLSITRPMPLTEGTLVLIGLVVLALSVQAARVALIAPLEMRRIRYVARFRIPLLLKVIAIGFILVLTAVAGRLLFFACQWLADRLIVRVESFWLQGSVYTVMAAGAVVLALVVLSRLPRKILVFEDRVVLKYLSYRSRSLMPSDIAEVSLRGFREVWLSRRLWRCLPLTIGIMSPGIYLRRRNGASLFFRVRRSPELLAVIEQVINQEAPAKPVFQNAVSDRGAAS